MASGIPTRRAARRVDENAPPTTVSASTRTRTANAATAAAGAGAKGNANTAIPVMKRATSAAALPSSSRDSKAPAPGPVKAATRRRAALGEIDLGENASKGGALDKSKPSGVERRPLASRSESSQTVRRSTRSAVTAPADRQENAAAVKRKAGASSTTATRRPALSRGASTASLASGSTSTSSTALRPTRHLKPTASLTDAGPSPKRFRKSTPEDDVFVGHHYDQDNKEVDLRAAPGPKSQRLKDDGWTDLDAEDEGDPTMVSEYVVEAFNYMLELEEQSMPEPDYMDKQEELQWKMRAILNDWIIEVHSKFRLLPETLLIATNLIDRFLSVRMVSLVKFQLVGLTALFVAAKYEEVICPSIVHFLHMTDGGFDTSEILRAERYLLSTLDFDLSYPNPLHFLRRISKADGYDVHSRTVAKFLIEINCIDHRLIVFRPSMLAAAAMWLARLCLDRGPWHANMVHYSGYAQHELIPCAQVMLDYIVNPDLDDKSAFYKKYAAKKHLKASVFVRDWAIHRWPDSAKDRSPVQGRELTSEYGEEVVAPLPCTP